MTANCDIQPVNAVQNVCEDIVYAVNEVNIFQKHIGIGCIIHKHTRSKELVDLLNRADHCGGYRDVYRIDTALAKHTLNTINRYDGDVTPANFVQ